MLARAFGKHDSLLVCMNESLPRCSVKKEKLLADASRARLGFRFAACIFVRCRSAWAFRRVMTTRKKKVILLASSTALVLVACWFSCSVLLFSSYLPLRDSIEVAWALRTHTLWPIHSSLKESDDKVSVIAGTRRSWVKGSGYYYYSFRRTEHGWRLSACCPVVFGNLRSWESAR
jgi:hypothetical protein